METPSMHRLKEIGPWSEQFSSSGKRYYYNRETEVSQWEKPAEWKQAEREQSENVKASATSTTSATKNSANSSAKISSTSTNKQRHRPGVSTSLTPRSSHTITVKPDSSTPANKICSSSTSNTAKRQRIDEDESKAVSSSSQKKQSANEVSSSTEVHNRNSHHGKEEDHHHGAGVSSSGQASASHKRICQSGPDQHHNSKANTPTNSLSTPQLQSINVEQKASALRSKHPSSSPSKRSDTPKEQSKESNSPPGTAKNDGGWEQPEVQEGFREEKHLKFYRPDVATSKRHLIPEAYLNDLKKCADRNAKQMASLFAIDNDIHSIRTLIKVGEFRTQLLRQRGDAIAKRIQELDSNGQ